jgi:CheY-like chemotaxis protein
MARVLVVDDDPDILTLFQLQLRRSGHDTTGASSGADALAIVDTQGDPDVAVLDISMPGMDGFELLKALRARPTTHNLPVIFLSARVQPEDIAAGKALGADYLTKPFSPTDLLAAIDRAVTSR